MDSGGIGASYSEYTGEMKWILTDFLSPRIIIGLNRVE